MKIEVYKTAEETLRSMTETLITVIKKSKSKPFHIALSGGSTAQQRTMRVAGRRREQFQTCRTPSFHASGYSSKSHSSHLGRTRT